MTETRSLHITIVYPDGMPSEPFDEFCNSISSDNLCLKVHKEENLVLRASIEDLLQTAIVVYIAKPYFEAFLSEMGKDHYLTLKAAIKSLFSKLKPMHARVVTAKGTKDRNSRYSVTYSIFAESAAGTRIKFLFPENAAVEEQETIIEAALEFLMDNHQGHAPEITDTSNDPRMQWLSVHALRFNEEKGEFEVVNPFPPQEQDSLS